MLCRQARGVSARDRLQDVRFARPYLSENDEPVRSVTQRPDTGARALCNSVDRTQSLYLVSQT